jgi:hypothetical protein
MSRKLTADTRDKLTIGDLYIGRNHEELGSPQNAVYIQTTYRRAGASVGIKDIPAIIDALRSIEKDFTPPTLRERLEDLAPGSVVETVSRRYAKREDGTFVPLTNDRGLPSYSSAHLASSSTIKVIFEAE